MLNAFGRVGRDAEARTTPNGKAVTNFSVAVNVGFGDRATTTWVECTLWGRDGKHHGLTSYLVKGAGVVVSGEPSVRTYAGKDGAVAVLDLTVRDITLTDKKGESSAPAQQKQERPKLSDFAGVADDDIPF